MPSLGEAGSLLRTLVRTPSPSGQEEGVARVLEGWARERGLSVTRDDAAVRIDVRSALPGPTLLMASHLDTVPLGEGWDIDPLGAELIGGVMHGRGTVDAKGPLSAMAVAALTLAAEGGPGRGRLIVLATYGEETRDTSMPRALETLDRRPDAAVVGEPTALEPCIAQRGLLILELIWRAEAMHAGWAAELPEKPVTAIEKAVAELGKLRGIELAPEHPVLGRTTATPTAIAAGGKARNVTPAQCSATLDIRTTTTSSHEEIVARLRQELDADLRVISDRLRPAQTPADSRLLSVVQHLRPEARPFASPTSSDWAFLRDLDAIKLGPGNSQLSHTNREKISLDEVEEAARLYADIARRFLA